MERVCSFINKHRDIVIYLFFGGLTTVVNYLIYVPLYHYLHFSAAFSNIIAWAVAVAFAFITNKPFVFKSYDWSRRVVLPEAGKFVGSRTVSGLLETGFIALTVDMLHWNATVMKIIASVMVIIVNYIASRWVVFSNRKNDI